MRGNQASSAQSEDGANGAGQPVPRPLSRPSPSANLVGIWKGDPLGPPCARATQDPRKLQTSSGLVMAWLVPRRYSPRSKTEGSWVMTTLIYVLIGLIGFFVAAAVLFWLCGGRYIPHNKVGII